MWTPSFVMLSLANVCCAMIFYLMTSATASLATHSFNATTGQAGIATGLFLIGAFSARASSGLIAERLGLRNTLVTTEALFALTSAAYLVVSTLPQLMALRALNGLAFGYVSTTLTSAALANVPAHRRGEGTGWFTSGMALGTGLGPLVSLNLLRVEGGDRVLLLLTGAVGLLGLVLVLLNIQRLPGRLRPHPDGPARNLVSRIVEPRVLPVAFVGLLAATAFSVVLTYLNEFTVGTSLERAAGFYFVVYALAMLVLRPPMGRLQDRHGNNVVIIPVLISLVTGVSLTAIAPNGVVLLIGAGLLGFGYGTFISSGQALSLNLVDPARATVAIASFFLLVDLGTGLGPAVLGNFFDLVGFRGIFAMGASLATIGLAIYIFLAVRAHRRQA